MKTKFHFLLLIFFFGNLFFSCQNDDSDNDLEWGNCPDVSPYFKINEISSQNLELTDNKYDRLKNIHKDSTVLWDKFHLTYKFKVDYIAKTKNINTSGSLMALSCAGPGYSGSKIGIDTLFIRTINKYNDKFSAGDTINEITKISDWSYYLNQNPEHLKSISQYTEANKENVLNESFTIKITEAPSNDGKHSFEVIYKLNNGETFKHTSSLVRLKK